MNSAPIREMPDVTASTQDQRDVVFARSRIRSAWDHPTVDSFGEGQSKSDQSSVSQRSRTKLIEFPRFTNIMESNTEFMWALMEWDGHVTEIDDQEFSAILTPVSGEERDTEVLSYPVRLLPREDREKLTIGSFFRLSCGFRRRAATERLNQEMVIYFRPALLVDVNESAEVANKIQKMFAQAVEAPAR